MILSLNEFEALTREAARGAGYSWGMAEEAGRAMRWLARNNVPGVGQFVDLLSRRSDQGKTCDQGLANCMNSGSNSLPTCPFATGTALSDGVIEIQAGETSIGPLISPHLALPFLSRVALETKQNLTLNTKRQRVHMSRAGGITCSSTLSISDQDTLLITVTRTKDPESNHVANRVEISERDLTILKNFAAKTYAPATEQSRITGAGAGLVDND